MCSYLAWSLGIVLAILLSWLVHWNQPKPLPTEAVISCPFGNDAMVTRDPVAGTYSVRCMIE